MAKKLCILVGKSQHESFKLEPDKEYTVGRHPENDIIILDKNISRNHFKIRVKGDKYFITDLASKTGTFVDGKDLIPFVETEAREGVPIIIGMTILCLGSICELGLKPFLDATGFSKEVNAYGELVKPDRYMAIKKNMEFLYNINNSLMKCKNIKEIFKVLLDSIFVLFKRIDRCVIITIDDQSGKFSNILYRSRKSVDDPKNIFNRELVEHALMIDKPMMIKDSNIMENEEDKVVESLQLMKIQSAICVPITSLSGHKGVIYIDSLSRAKGFRKNDLALLKDVSGRAARAIDKISLIDTL